MNTQTVGPVISELYLYPIKSFRGLRVSQLRLDANGPRYDRQWMLVDNENSFLTMRQLPQLAKIGLRMEEDIGIELSAGEHGIVDFGLNEQEGEVMSVKIWKDVVPAFEVSYEISEWLTKVVGQKVKLVRMSDEAKRPFSDKFPDRNIRFVDSQPILVIGRESLNELERRAKITLSVSRFRPNIVIDQSAMHAEDTWAGFKADGVEFTAMKPCVRCKITTVHPLTGVVGEEPLKTLATYRNQGAGITFGHLYAHAKTGTIKTGARVSPH